MKVKELPALQQNTFTPKGYVDWDFTWKNDNVIIVSRAKGGNRNSTRKRPLPSLYEIDSTSDEQHRITKLPHRQGDYHPLFMNKSNQLIWIRSDRKKADVWLAHKDGKHEMKWIENIDVPEWYYEKWNWGNVISVKKNKNCLKDCFRQFLLFMCFIWLFFAGFPFPWRFLFCSSFACFSCSVSKNSFELLMFISLLSFCHDYYNHLGG